MPGGARLGGEGAQTPGGVDGARAEADELGAPVAVDEARGPGAAAAFGCARAGAEPAVEAAAAVRHGGLATGAAGASAGAAARGAQVVAAGVAVLEAAAPGVRGGVEFWHRHCRGRPPGSGRRPAYIGRRNGRAAAGLGQG